MMDESTEARLANLERLVAEQQAEIERLRVGRQLPPAAAPDGRIDRRDLLRKTGVAAVGVMAVGAAAVAATPTPAAAADGDPITMGETTTGSSAAATVAIAPTIPTVGFAFTDNPDFQAMPPALGFPTSVLTVDATAANRIALSAGGPEYGLYASGQRAPILLAPNGVQFPFDDDQPHRFGELMVTTNAAGASLWFCVNAGTPGDWSLVAAPGSASTVGPGQQRLYDSRTTGGRLSSGQTRVISLGIPTVPIRAWLLNLTITETAGTGYLQLYSNAMPSPPQTSSVNWFTSNQNAANSVMTAADSIGNVRVTAGGGGSTQFIVDLLATYQ
jgi:hypothetical protein